MNIFSNFKFEGVNKNYLFVPIKVYNFVHTGPFKFEQIKSIRIAIYERDFIIWFFNFLKPYSNIYEKILYYLIKIIIYPYILLNKQENAKVGYIEFCDSQGVFLRKKDFNFSMLDQYLIDDDEEFHFYDRVPINILSSVLRNLI